jgi:hypothetical protein
MTIVSDSQAEPSEADKAQYRHLWQNVDTGKNWYAYLRELQGSLMGHIQEGIMLVDNNTTSGVLWVYVVNLDTGELEVYGGDDSNSEPRAECYGCPLIVSYPLDAIPENFSELVERLAYPENFEDEDAA